MSWTIEFGNARHPERHLVRNLTELREQLAKACRPARAELELAQDETAAVIAAIDGDKAMIAARLPGTETFFTAVNPTYTGPADAQAQICLANGQIDNVPANWIVPREEAVRTVEQVFISGQLPGWLMWV